MDPTRQDAAAVQPTSFMVPTQGGYQIATAPKEDGAQGGRGWLAWLRAGWEGRAEREAAGGAGKGGKAGGGGAQAGAMARGRGVSAEAGRVRGRGAEAGKAMV